MKILEEPLEDTEKVYYVLERNMKRRRIIYSMVVVGLCILAFLTLHTMIVPFGCLLGLIFCVFWGIVPRVNVPVAWVLTNKRYLCIHLDPKKYQNTEVRIMEYIDIEPIRENLNSTEGVDIIAELIMIPFLGIFSFFRDYFQNKNVKTSKKYWADSKGVTLICTDEKRISISIDNKKASSDIGCLLALVLEQGWEHIPERTHPPSERTISLI